MADDKGRISKSLRTGWLLKKSDHVGIWRRRYFVLIIEPPMLIYMKSESDDIHQPRGCIVLSGATVEEESSEPSKNVYQFSVKPDRSRIYYFRVNSRHELDSWINDIDKAANVHRGPLMEYKGRDINDPHDAKEIALASVEIQKWAHNEYLSAYNNLVKIKLSSIKGQILADKLKAQKKLLSKEVRSLQKSIEQLQNKYIKATEELKILKKSEVVNEPIEKVLETVKALKHDLEQSDPEYLANLAGNEHLEQDELILMSNNMLNYFEAHISTCISKDIDEELRKQLEDLLKFNSDIRKQMNHYADHLITLTKAKLEEFERQQQQVDDESKQRKH